MMSIAMSSFVVLSVLLFLLEAAALFCTLPPWCPWPPATVWPLLERTEPAPWPSAPVVSVTTPAPAEPLMRRLFAEPF
jgi:hypothetical protein